MSFSSVAEYSFTAIDTRPNETAPFQIARITGSYPRRLRNPRRSACGQPGIDQDRIASVKREISETPAYGCTLLAW